MTEKYDGWTRNMLIEAYEAQVKRAEDFRLALIERDKAIRELLRR